MDDQRTNGERGAISLVVALILGAVTYICYGFAGIMLYRQRVISEAMLWDSDFLVFYLPFLVTVGMITSIFGLSLRLQKTEHYAFLVAIVVGVTIVVALMYATAAFNSYGT